MKTTKLLVLYYSMYGHVESMAEAVTEGARAVAQITHWLVQGKGG